MRFSKIRKHKTFVQDRTLELRAQILLDACYKNKIDKIKVNLFLKYNERLIKLNKKINF